VGLIGFFIVPLIGGFIVYWIIRSAVFGGMRDFEKWKHKQYGASDNYDYEQP
jgi:hypothetical protein